MPGPIITVEELRAQLAAGDAPRLLEVRWALDGSQTREDHLAGHLPGAQYVDLSTELAAPAEPARGRHPLPDPEAFAVAMRRVGLQEGEPVVAADAADGSQAARLVWMLRVLDHPARLLSGGVRAWKESGGPLESGEAPAPAPGGFRARPWPAELLVSIDEAAHLARSGEAVVLDARAGARYRGESEPVDPRPGHIPGARSAPFSENLEADGRFRPDAALRERFAGLGVRTTGPTVVYCGSGVTAAHDLLALEQAGFTDLRLFPGSWSQYSDDTQREAATGPQPFGD